jgi:hypothetical protein
MHCSAASVGVAVSRTAKMIALFLICCINTLSERHVCFAICGPLARRAGF